MNKKVLNACGVISLRQHVLSLYIPRKEIPSHCFVCDGQISPYPAVSDGMCNHCSTHYSTHYMRRIPTGDKPIGEQDTHLSLLIYVREYNLCRLVSAEDRAWLALRFGFSVRGANDE